MKMNLTKIITTALAILLLVSCWGIRTAAYADDVFTETFSERDLSGSYDGEPVLITLNGAGAQTDSDKVQISGSVVTVTGAGTYILTGTLDNGCVIVDAGKDDKVQLVLNGVSIHADSFAAIYVKQADKVFVTMKDGTVNALSSGGFSRIDENEVDAVIFSKDDLTLNGSGTLQVVSPAGHGIVCKDELKITGGVYAIQAAQCAVKAKDSIAVADGSLTLRAGSDGLHAENGDDETLGNILIAGGSFDIQAVDDAVHANTLLRIDGGSFEITAAEGIEATYIQINDGSVRISATDDGVNAARKSSAYTPTVEINGGEIAISMGPGDTDGVDSNGDLIIRGGTVSVTGNSCFDYDGTAAYTGGTVIVNGQQVDSIPNQIMGGRGGMMGSMGNRSGMMGGPGMRGGKGW